MEKRLRIAQMQIHTYREIDRTINSLKKAFHEISKSKPDFVCLGEMFICPYNNMYFRQYAEEEGGPVWQICSDLAKEYNIYLSAGTMPELSDDRLYNTAYVFNRDGQMIAKYRKKHLFDIDIPGKQKFKESDTLSPGDEYVVFNTEYGKMGVCICFDIRFPDQARKMIDSGAKMIICPASFNSTTGPMHWELLFRARAVDNQCFYIGTGGALDENFAYKAYGHSIVVSPWGIVLNQMDEKEGIMITDIDLIEVDDFRKAIPIGINS